MTTHHDPDDRLTATAHTSTLAEYHAVTTVFPATMSAAEIGRRYQATVDVQHEIGNRWAAAHGLEITYVTETDPQDDGSVHVTTSWVVQIGRGVIEADPEVTDHCAPGAMDRWCWSARVGHWRNLLQGLGREGRRLAVREDGLASVHHIHGSQAPAFSYLPGTGPAEHRPAWLQNDSVAGDVGGDWSNT